MQLPMGKHSFVPAGVALGTHCSEEVQAQGLVTKQVMLNGAPRMPWVSSPLGEALSSVHQGRGHFGLLLDSLFGGAPAVDRGRAQAWDAGRPCIPSQLWLIGCVFSGRLPSREGTHNEDCRHWGPGTAQIT